MRFARVICQRRKTKTGRRGEEKRKGRAKENQTEGELDFSPPPLKELCPSGSHGSGDLLGWILYWSVILFAGTLVYRRTQLRTHLLEHLKQKVSVLWGGGCLPCTRARARPPAVEERGFREQCTNVQVFPSSLSFGKLMRARMGWCGRKNWYKRICMFILVCVCVESDSGILWMLQIQTHRTKGRKITCWKCRKDDLRSCGQFQVKQTKRKSSITRSPLFTPTAKILQPWASFFCRLLGFPFPPPVSYLVGAEEFSAWFASSCYCFEKPKMKSFLSLCFCLKIVPWSLSPLSEKCDFPTSASEEFIWGLTSAS